MSLLHCERLALGYDNKVVVEDLNFTVNEGDYLCIIGENGSGKSTLMRTLLHLQAPLGGSIRMGDGLKRDQIGYLPQQTSIQKDFPATVYEIVISGCLSRGRWSPFYNKNDKLRAWSIMEKLNISGISKRSYRELSGGQQQRVLLARALCAAGKMLLLDEPVAGLDPIVTAEMYELIHQLNREAGITIIMISHDIQAALKYATHILHIGDQPLFFGTKTMYAESEIGRKFTDVEGGGANA